MSYSALGMWLMMDELKTVGTETQVCVCVCVLVCCKGILESVFVHVRASSNDDAYS